MKPALILQHLHADGPAYLGTWLQQQGQRFEVFNTEAGQAFPHDIGRYGALAVLGGEMSANDPLPSLRDAERLIRQAMAADVPVLGHCLGGQLMARALGARVVDSPAPELGWHRVQLLPHADAACWFGELDDMAVFQWHFDAFELPDGARPLARSAACANQAFSIGPHLAMQFHVELDEPKLRLWMAAHADGGDAVPTLHGASQIWRDTAVHLAAQQRLADRIYGRWLESARRGG